jgi:hypothetical protein
VRGRLGNTLQMPSAFANRRQVVLRITRKTTSTRHFLTGSRHLGQGIRVRAHANENDKAVLPAGVREILRDSEIQERREDGLNSRIARQIDENERLRIAPPCWKSSRKKRETSMLTPAAENTMVKSSSAPVFSMIS